MSNVMAALIASLSFGAWIYNKSHERTGGNTRNSIIFALVAGGIVFILVVTLLDTFL